MSPLFVNQQFDAFKGIRVLYENPCPSLEASLNLHRGELPQLRGVPAKSAQVEAS